MSAQHVVAQKAPNSASKASMAPVIQSGELSDGSQPAWLAKLLDDPDPQVRLQGLEAWARHPGETLDAVTYTLVDPDELVRARAQALFEEALLRR